MGRTAIGGRWRREADVDISAIECKVLPARHILFKTQSDSRMTRLVFAQQVGEKRVAGKSYKADSKPAYFSLGSSLGSSNGSLCLRERLHCFLIEDLPLRSKPSHAAVSRAKFDAKLSLKTTSHPTSRSAAPLH